MFVFFFQAEDGIRGHCVTGVQTCALPISLALIISPNIVIPSMGPILLNESSALISRESGASPAQEMAYGLAIARAYIDHALARGLAIDPVARSEERRVGKECRARWGARR